MRLPDLDLRLYVPRPPFWLVALILLSVLGSFIPIAAIARHRVIKHREPRYHVFLDMDNQAKLKTQHGSPVFADGRAMRPRVEGTVARGEQATDDLFHRGYRVTGGGEGGEPVTTYLGGYPREIDLDDRLLATGRVKYNTFCAPCHGASGNGMGTVQQRALKLVERGNTGTSWTPVANLHALGPDGAPMFGEAAYPNGKLFNTISLGKGAMSGYAAQITPADRWAIVAYVRALQLTQTTTPAAAEAGPGSTVVQND